MAKESEPQQMMGPLALAIIVAAILFSAAYYYSPAKAAAASSLELQPRLLHVSSDASQEVAPDKVEVTLAVVSRGMDPAEVQSDNDARLRQIKSTLISLGVPEANIKTVGYSLDRYQEYNKSLEAYVDMGYRLSNSLRVVSYDVLLAGKIVKGAVDSGANEVTGISFGLSDASKKTAYGALLRSAASSAKEKAQAMASSAGVSILGLYSMNEGYNYVEPMANYNYKDAASSSGAPAPEVSISAGLVRITASVGASYEIAG
ncbi:MAG: SIMPL domain-containing protein [Candidatus Micrarchaeia archaeon]|jgi:hypothetical protein